MQGGRGACPGEGRVSAWPSCIHLDDRNLLKLSRDQQHLRGSTLLVQRSLPARPPRHLLKGFIPRPLLLLRPHPTSLRSHGGGDDAVHARPRQGDGPDRLRWRGRLEGQVQGQQGCFGRAGGQAGVLLGLNVHARSPRTRIRDWVGPRAHRESPRELYTFRDFLF